MLGLACFTLLCVQNVLAAPTCDGWIRPLDPLDPAHLAGRWALVAGSASDQALLESFKVQDSELSMEFSNGTTTSNLSYTARFRFDGQCHHRTYGQSVALGNSTLSFDGGDGDNVTLTFIHTSCPDCLVYRFNDRAKTERLLLFSRRRAVETEEMEEFRAQVKCLEMPPPATLDTDKPLC